MGKVVKVRSIFDPTEDEGIDCRVLDPKTGEYKFHTLTKQSEKDACDLNLIMARYEKTGVLPDMIRSNPQYGDFSSVPDFLQAQLLVRKANDQFAALDAHVRDRFGNDPAYMLAFCADPANAEEMVKLGLAVAKPNVPTGAPDTGAKESTNGGSTGSAVGPKA